MIVRLVSPRVLSNRASALLCRSEQEYMLNKIIHTCRQNKSLRERRVFFVFSGVGASASQPPEASSSFDRRIYSHSSVSPVPALSGQTFAPQLDTLRLCEAWLPAGYDHESSRGAHQPNASWTSNTLPILHFTPYYDGYLK